MLQLTSQVLTNIPDNATLWNIRREAFIKMKSEDEPNFCKVLVPKELELTENCLKSNPKSYSSWHHRRWLMIETNFENVEKEVKICAKYLQLDDRNFHVWGYRNFLLANSKTMTVEEELQFTTEKIVSNFSNYSSWHLRSTLLPRLSYNYFSEELDLIKNAAFTDPNDQSVWFYHRWLLRSQPKSPEFQSTLREELLWIQELHELEPENKWTLSALILVMDLLDSDEFKSQRICYLDDLVKLDPMRKNYYKHLRTKWEKQSHDEDA